MHGPQGDFARELTGNFRKNTPDYLLITTILKGGRVFCLGHGVNISGLPHLRMIGGSGDYITLADGSMVGIAKSTLSKAASPSGRLSAVAVRSTDGGFNWTFASVVARAEEVPQASEGPSEGSLATLKNGTLMAVMRKLPRYLYW